MKDVDGVRVIHGPEWLMDKIAEYGATRFCEAKYPDAPGGVAVELFREIEAHVRGVASTHEAADPQRNEGGK